MYWSYLLALTFKAIKVPSSFSGDVLFFLFLLSLGVSSIKTKNNKGFNFMSISFHELPLPRLAGLYCSGLIAFNERGRLLFEQYRSRRHAISRVLAPSWTDWLVHLAQISSVFLSLGNWYLFCDSRQPQMEHWRVCVYCCLSFFSQFLIQFFFLQRNLHSKYHNTSSGFSRLDTTLQRDGFPLFVAERPAWRNYCSQGTF